MKINVIKSIIILLICALVVLISILIFNKEEEKPPIFEIENTAESFNKGGSKDGDRKILKYYIIKSPPSDLNKLKIMVDKFLSNNLIFEEIRKTIPTEKKTYSITLRFLRISDNLPENWQPFHGFGADEIDHHFNDLVATVSCYNDKTKYYYTLMKRSNDHDSYGDIIQEIVLEE